MNIWLERPFPEGLRHLLTPDIQLLGPASAALAEAEGIIAGGLIYDAALMDSAPRLKVISRLGIGVDTVDVAAATARGIVVCNTPDGPTTSTAEHTILLMLAVAKRLRESEARLRAGEGVIYASHDGVELEGLTLGLLGFGRIARRVARVAQALGMRVIACDPYVPAEVMEQQKVDVYGFEQLLATADVVSLHLPLMASTHKLMNAERFAQMKPGAIFINASRGGLVDEQALCEAVTSGHLFGAGLDVSDPEPPLLENPLLGCANVVMTPHVASATIAGKARIYEKAFTQVLQVLRGERPDHLVNPEVWDRHYA
jgi:D-3-phosphoglycerate dehydrogenase